MHPRRPPRPGPCACMASPYFCLGCSAAGGAGRQRRRRRPVGASLHGIASVAGAVLDVESKAVETQGVQGTVGSRLRPDVTLRPLFSGLPGPKVCSVNFFDSSCDVKLRHPRQAPCCRRHPSRHGWLCPRQCIIVLRAVESQLLQHRVALRRLVDTLVPGPQQLPHLTELRLLGCPMPRALAQFTGLTCLRALDIPGILCNEQLQLPPGLAVLEMEDMPAQDTFKATSASDARPAVAASMLIRCGVPGPACCRETQSLAPCLQMAHTPLALACLCRGCTR